MDEHRTVKTQWSRFRDFIEGFSKLADFNNSESELLNNGGALLRQLVAHDDWLDPAFAAPHPDHYTQYLLYADPTGRFSVVSFVWGPGQGTPIHDHTVWGLIGMLRGAERAQSFTLDNGTPQPHGTKKTLHPGDVEAVSPSIGDVHQVANAFDDRVSVSIHVYGANIGAIRRAVYMPDGTVKPFISGYANAVLPNLWRVLPGDVPDRSVQDVRAALLARREVALLDVREEAPFAEAHPLFAANMPYSAIETQAAQRLPRKDVPIVVYDDGEGLARRAAHRLRALGYVDVCLLAGGLAGWRRAGGELFRDVNVPSKSFGELVESQRHTPSLSAEAVQALIDARADVVILDARRFDEYNTMSIPGGISVPGAELALRIKDLAPDPSTQVIVNCAGRTRSIIGTQSLVNVGIPNPVAALRNGTIGWTLAGQTLERGQSRRHDHGVAQAWHADAQTRARRLADRAGVSRVSLAHAFQQSADRTCYWLDVRTPEEYARRHLAGFANAPGGQLVQETDHVVAVRGARIVLVDDDGVRANMTASWLAQMGWDVHVVDDAPPVDEWPVAEVAPAPPRAEHVPQDRWVDGTTLAAWLEDPAVTSALRIIDMGSSAEYRKHHVPGASHVRRADAPALARLLACAPHATRVVLTSSDGALAAFGWSDVVEALRAWGVGAAVYVLRNGSRGWTQAGESLTAEAPDWVVEPTDRYRRPYEGTDNPVAAMQGYLDWEYGLVDQLARDGTHGFKVLAAE